MCFITIVIIIVIRVNGPARVLGNWTLRLLCSVGQGVWESLVFLELLSSIGREENVTEIEVKCVGFLTQQNSGGARKCVGNRFVGRIVNRC